MKEVSKLETHTEILVTIHKLVNRNITPYEHARESIDDIISDLMDYRDTLPTIDAYMEAKEL